MDRREVAPRLEPALDSRNSRAPTARLPQKEIRRVNLRAGLGQSIQKLKRQSDLLHLLTKLRTIRPVPGNNGIEGLKLRDQARWRLHAWQPEQVNSRGCDSSRLRPTDQRNYERGYPHFGGLGSKRFDGGQRQDAIADTAWSNDEPARRQLSANARGGLPQGTIHILNAQVHRFGLLQVRFTHFEMGGHHAIHHAVGRNRLLQT
jgi:hypothetical protein